MFRFCILSLHLMLNHHRMVISVFHFVFFLFPQFSGHAETWPLTDHIFYLFQFGSTYRESQTWKKRDKIFRCTRNRFKRDYWNCWNCLYKKKKKTILMHQGAFRPSEYRWSICLKTFKAEEPLYEKIHVHTQCHNVCSNEAVEWNNITSCRQTRCRTKITAGVIIQLHPD